MSFHPNAMLAAGAIAPDCALPDGRALREQRGAPLILAFGADAFDNWNPAREEVWRIFGELARDFAPPLEQTETRGEIAQLPLQRLDARGEIARACGINRDQALLVLDENNIVRWACAWNDDATPRTGEVLAALETLRPTQATDSQATTESATTQLTQSEPTTTQSMAPQSKEAAAESAAMKSATDAATTQAAATQSTTTQAAMPLSRRAFLASALAASFALAALPATGRAQNIGTRNQAEDAPAVAAQTLPVTLQINGSPRPLQLDSRVALLDVLRENLGLTGTKKGCDHGQCGACTVHIDGESALSCLTLAAMSQGREITTIEGLARGETLHPLQAAFIEYDGYQCGYCTPGQLMSATALLRAEGATQSDAELRDSMSGNLCRCGAYPNILAAIKAVRDA